MKKMVCTVCGYIYDPKEHKDVEFNELKEDWTCPVCEASKEEFEEML